MSNEIPPPPPTPEKGANGRFGGDQGWPKWMIGVLAAVILGVLLLTFVANVSSGEQVSYGEFKDKLNAEPAVVKTATYDNTNGHISAELNDGSKVTTTGPTPLPDQDAELFSSKGVKFETPTSSIWETLLPLLLPVGLLILFFVWMQRRAQGQMGGIMSIGRSKAKTYSAERPGTTFADVAGYEGVKQEITEVVDFLKYPERFAEIGARIPKGILLVGPPGTGKTLIAAPSPVRRACRSCRSRARTSWRCSSVSAPAGCATCSPRPARWAGPSSSWTRSTPSAASAAPASAAVTTSGSRRSTRCCRRWTASRPPPAS